MDCIKVAIYGITLNVQKIARNNYPHSYVI